LQIKCNNFDHPDPPPSQYYPSGSANIYNGSGKLADQGSYPNNQSEDKKPAGNEFLNVNNANPFGLNNRNEILTLQSCVYYRHNFDENNPPGLKILPADVSPPGTPFYIVYNQNVNVNKTSNSCAVVQYPCGSCGGNIPCCRIVQLNDQAAQMQTLNQEFSAVSSMLDHGQTTNLLNYINDSIPDNALADTLINNSPLSDAVLSAYIAKNGISASSFLSAMTPNLPVSDNVQPALLEKISTFNSDFFDAITNLQGYNPNYRTLTAIQRDINHTETDRAQTLSEVIGYYAQNDTLDTSHASIDSLTALLENEHTDYTNQLLSSLYLSEGNLSAASAKLNVLPNSTDEDQAYVNLSNMLINLGTDSLSVFDMDSAQVQLVRQTATMGISCLARTNARAILLLVFNERYAEEIPGGNFARKSNTTNKPTPKAAAKERSCSIYPNPASDNMELHYQLAEGETGLLEIFSMVGSKVASYSVSSERSMFNIAAGNFENGLYMYRFSVSGELVKEGKLIIIRK
jgi:hypothetical protein